MRNPRAPGVFIREVSSRPPAIEAVPTAVTIFVGETERGPVGPVKINSVRDFSALYGGFTRRDDVRNSDSAARLFMPFAVQGFFINGGSRAYILRLVSGDPGTASLNVTNGTDISAITASAPGEWGNALRIIISDATDGDAAKFNLNVFYTAPGADDEKEVEVFEDLSPDVTDTNNSVDQLARSNYIRWNGADVFRPLNVGDLAATPKETIPLTDTAGAGGDATVAAAHYPAALTSLDNIDDAALIVCGSDGMVNDIDAAEHNGLINSLLAYTETRRQGDLFLVADAPRLNDVTGRVAAAVENTVTEINASEKIAVYWPHIVVGDPSGVGRNPTLEIPAAGHIAGLYGRTDRSRGVWKAPAGVNAVLAGVTKFDFDVSSGDQAIMNPRGLNAIRTFPGAGRVVWGARTLRPMPERRFINVQRTAMFLRKSISNGTQWAAFEDNDEALWAALQQNIKLFMETLFREGAFAGQTSRDAYFVKCDSDTTTPNDQSAGIVNVHIGFAPTKPAEFLILTLSQKTAS